MTLITLRPPIWHCHCYSINIWYSYLFRHERSYSGKRCEEDNQGDIGVLFKAFIKLIKELIGVGSINEEIETVACKAGIPNLLYLQSLFRIFYSSSLYGCRWVHQTVLFWSLHQRHLSNFSGGLLSTQCICSALHPCSSGLE